MPTHLAELLRDTLDAELSLLLSVDETRALTSFRAGGWTRKQELGHLLDSAVNNHNRIVRAALENRYEGPGYAQDSWVDLHGYSELPWRAIVDLWFQHNRLIAWMIERIPAAALEAPCVVGGGEPVTLRFLIEDYVRHMKHHLDRIMNRATSAPAG